MSLYDHSKGVKKLLLQRYLSKTYQIKDYRQPSGIEYKDHPSIILLGCSFVYGVGLKDNETFSYILSKNLKRTVYNYAMNGGGVRDALHILRSDDILNYFSVDKHNVQYVIYTYIDDHQHRLYSNLHPFEADFKVDGNYLSEIKRNKIIRNSYLYFLYSDLEYYLTSGSKKWELYCKYIKNIEQEIQTRFSNGNKKTKFIIFNYGPEIGNEKWAILSDDNTIVLNLKDLVDIDITDKKYVIYDGAHPSAKVWQLVVPELIKRLNFE